MTFENFEPLGLNDFFQAAAENEVRSADAHSEILGMLGLVHNQFTNVLFAEKIESPPLSSVLMMNAHASFLAAVRLSLSGQSPPTFMVLRGSLESAAYALLARDKSNETIYHDRKRNKRRCQNVFTMSNAAAKLESFDSNLSERFKLLYNGFIDLGAHPNTDSVLNHLKSSVRDDGLLSLSLVILHDAKSDAVLQALLACVEAGIALLFISPHVLREQTATAESHCLGRVLEASKDAWVQIHHPNAHKKAVEAQNRRRSRRQ